MSSVQGNLDCSRTVHQYTGTIFGYVVLSLISAVLCCERRPEGLCIDSIGGISFRNHDSLYMWWFELVDTIC